jgi:hypothetical protein
MTGSCLTTATPEAAPGELFAGDAATLKSEQLLSDLRGFFRRWRHATSFKLKRWASSWSDFNASFLRGSALRRSRVFQLRECLQPCPSSEPLQCHMDIKGSLLKRTGCSCPIHASASEGKELSDRRRCEKFAT